MNDCIDRNALKERLGGDFELFKELAGLFLDESPGLVEAVEEAVRNRIGDRIGKTAHTVKGAVANFSAGKAYNAALELEKIGKNRELDRAPDACRTLLREIESLRDALKSIMEAKEL